MKRNLSLLYSQIPPRGIATTFARLIAAEHPLDLDPTVYTDAHAIVLSWTDPYDVYVQITSSATTTKEFSIYAERTDGAIPSEIYAYSAATTPFAHVDPVKRLFDA